MVKKADIASLVWKDFWVPAPQEFKTIDSKQEGSTATITQDDLSFDNRSQWSI